MSAISSTWSSAFSLLYDFIAFFRARLRLAWRIHSTVEKNETVEENEASASLRSHEENRMMLSSNSDSDYDVNFDDELIKNMNM